MKRRNFKTEDERKEAKRIYNAEWRLKNKDKNRNYRNEWANNSFYVYTHTNSKGDLYIGSGNKIRPNQLTECSRSKYWIKAFKEDCTVKIIRKFNTKEDAKNLEYNMIRAIGLNNLINTRQAK